MPRHTWKMSEEDVLRVAQICLHATIDGAAAAANGATTVEPVSASVRSLDAQLAPHLTILDSDRWQTRLSECVALGDGLLQAATMVEQEFNALEVADPHTGGWCDAGLDAVRVIARHGSFKYLYAKHGPRQALIWLYDHDAFTTQHLAEIADLCGVRELTMDGYVARLPYLDIHDAACPDHRV